MEERSQAQAVANYYNRNTRLFLSLGGSGIDSAAIHRQIWTPGVHTRRASFAFLDEHVAGSLPAKPGGRGLRFLDLGCGIGGSATWIASHLEAQVVGVTLSSGQVRMAQQRVSRLGLAERCQFVQADFLHLPELGIFDGAWAVESYSHAVNSQRFFEQVARVLRPGGRLVIADDFIAPSTANNPCSTRWVEQFTSGWQLVNLGTVASTLRQAEQAGFRLMSDEDLSQYLRFAPAWVTRPAAVLLSLPLPWSFWRSLRGSTALQICGEKGWTQYHFITWEKVL